MRFGLAVDLAGRGLEDARAVAMRKLEQVQRTLQARLQRMHRLGLVVDGRCATRQVEDDVRRSVEVRIERLGYVMSHEADSTLARCVVQHVGEVAQASCHEAVHRRHVIAVLYESPAKVRPEESRAAGDQRPATHVLVPIYAVHIRSLCASGCRAHRCTRARCSGSRTKPVPPARPTSSGCLIRQVRTGMTRPARSG